MQNQLKRLKVKAVLFDLWGTLIYNAPDPIDYAAIASQIGVEPRQLFGVWRSYNQAALTGGIKSGEERARKVLTDLGLSLDLVPVLVDMEIRGRITNVNFYPGVTELLATLRQHKIQTGLVSNSNYLVAQVVQELELAEKMDVLILSYDVGLVKPERAIYELAIKRLGVAAHECLYVGDGSDNEMTGAIEMGLHTALVEQERGYAYRNPGDFGTDFRVAQIADILNHLELD